MTSVRPQLAAMLEQALRSEAPPAIALMRLLMEAPSEAEARAALESARLSGALGPGAAERLRAVEALWLGHPAAWSTVRATVADIAHQHRDPARPVTLAYWAEAFDRLVETSPEASVALYSLGSPDILAAATHEVCDRMADWGLLGRDRDALDLGCGIGRFLEALSPRLRSIVGLDVSSGMVAEARRRCAALVNVRIGQTSGRDLEPMRDRSLDLVLAADVFPYLVETGGDLAANHLAEIGRVLRPGGHGLILNYTYEGDPASHGQHISGVARSAGLMLLRTGTHDLRLWDAATFLLQKPPGR